MNQSLAIIAILFVTITDVRAEVLAIDIKGFRNREGRATCTLFNQEDGFPSEPEKAFNSMVAEIQADNSARCTFNIPAGREVAVAVLHDEDQDGKMKTNFIGIPREGWGVSNNAPAQTFGPPLYEDARFDPTIKQKLTIAMNY